LREYAPSARPYELMTIFTPEVADDGVTEQLEVIAGYVRTAGGAVYQVLQDAPWGRRRFAYPIRHNGRDVRDGFYSVLHFDLAPGQVFEVERDLKLDERVLRFLLTLNDTKETTAASEPAEGEAAPPTPEPRTEIAAGDLLRSAEAARAAQETARAAQEAARAAQEAARPAPPQDNRDQRPRPAAQPSAEAPSAEGLANETSVEEASAVPASTEAAPGATDATDAPAVTERESAPNVAPVAAAAPVVEAAPDDTAVSETTTETASEPETAPADGDEPSRT
jgi:small subunit ribosomal protein S6